MVEAEADELVAKYGTPRRTAILSDGAHAALRGRWDSMPGDSMGRLCGVGVGDCHLRDM